MICRRDDMQVQVRPEMKGGTGEVTVTHLVDTEPLKNIRLLGELDIPKGSSVGEHSHENETEYFLIMEGTAVATDNGVEEVVNTGEVIVTGAGSTHSIRNDEDAPLKVLAFIVTDAP
jgi:quercetin dioxygenase-like cupin family protein